MAEGFKPNIYPIMYWALAFGSAAGIALYLLRLLSSFIGVVWVPVFLAGMVWGGYRQYQKQKAAWASNSGIPLVPQSPVNEFKAAVSDVMDASREMMAEQRAEDAANEAQVQAEGEAQNEEIQGEAIQPEEEITQEESEEELPPTPLIR